MADLCKLDNNDCNEEEASSSIRSPSVVSHLSEEDRMVKERSIDMMFDRLQKCYEEGACTVPLHVKALSWDKCEACEEHIPIVRDAIKIGAKAVWMQEGIINQEAAAAARKAGLKVVMNKCMRKQHIRLHGGKE